MIAARAQAEACLADHAVVLEIVHQLRRDSDLFGADLCIDIVSEGNVASTRNLIDTETQALAERTGCYKRDRRQLL